MKKTAKFYYKSPDAPKPNQPLNLGVAGFVEKGDRVLLECRTDSGRWALIGGSIDHGESLQDCLIRELMEETGMDVMGYRLFGIFSDPSRIVEYPDGNIVRSVTVAYRVEVDPAQEPTISEESIALRFFSKEELRTVDIVETHRHIVDRWLDDSDAVVLV